MSYLNKFAAVLFVCLGICAEAMAANPVYTVDVEVDVTDVNAAKAREKAMASANRKAFETVVRKLTTSQQAAPLLRMSDEQILNFIKEVSVVSEKSSHVRYIAALKVTINENILKSYMAEKDIQSVIEASSKVTVIPVFRAFETDKPLLWEDGNIWRKAWENKAPRNSLVTVSSLPYLASVTADAALAYDREILETVRLNSNANDVYVADAVFDGIDGLKVTLSSLNNSTNAAETLHIAGDRNFPDELFARAIDDVSTRIENKIKVRNIAENQMQTSIDVIYNFSSLADWVNVEKNIKSIPYVRGLQVTAMTAGKVQFRLEFVGADEKMLQALRNKGFELKEYGSFYEISRFMAI